MIGANCQSVLALSVARTRNTPAPMQQIIVFIYLFIYLIDLFIYSSAYTACELL